ncbi:MAG: CBS domain-containing protein [Pseudomonadales bacterium]|nr:CBS domain-containing protein [Pseudomonadales bacterium]NRA14146.1 CBS domain-containing protein [Oceanospirillaceae bacterium]
MALLIFNNGTLTPGVSRRQQTNPGVVNHSLKQLDLSLPLANDYQPQYQSQGRQQTAGPQKKAATLAAPGQTLSYINTSKTANTLENRRRLSAAHVMSSPVITAVAHDLVSHAQQLMQENDISHIVIIDSENHPLGMISANELLKIESPQSSFIQSMLGAKVLAVSEDTLVRDVAITMMKYKVSAFSVVNARHQVTGIISRSDLLSLLVRGPNQRTTA